MTGKGEISLFLSLFVCLFVCLFVWLALWKFLERFPWKFPHKKTICLKEKQVEFFGWFWVHSE